MVGLRVIINHSMCLSRTSLIRSPPLAKLIPNAVCVRSSRRMPIAEEPMGKKAVKTPPSRCSQTSLSRRATFAFFLLLLFFFGVLATAPLGSSSTSLALASVSSISSSVTLRSSRPRFKSGWDLPTEIVLLLLNPLLSNTSRFSGSLRSTTDSDPGTGKGNLFFGGGGGGGLSVLASKPSTFAFIRSRIPSTTCGAPRTTMRSEALSLRGNWTMRDCADFKCGPPDSTMMSLRVPPWREGR